MRSGTCRRAAASGASGDSVRRPAWASAQAVAFVAAEITRDGAREDARRELTKAIYHRDEPGWVQRVLRAVAEFIGDLLGRASGLGLATDVALIALIIVVALLAIAARLGLGPLRARDALADRRGRARRMSAADYRAEAVALAARGEWREAVRARFRAVIRELEERGVLDPRPGRTAGEIAAEAGASVPAIGGDLRVAADIFNTIWYGDRPATQPAYDRMAQVDDSVRGGRLAVRQP